MNCYKRKNFLNFIFILLMTSCSSTTLKESQIEQIKTAVVSMKGIDTAYQSHLGDYFLSKVTKHKNFISEGDRENIQKYIEKRFHQNGIENVIFNDKKAKGEIFVKISPGRIKGQKYQNCVGFCVTCEKRLWDEEGRTLAGAFFNISLKFVKKNYYYKKTSDQLTEVDAPTFCEGSKYTEAEKEILSHTYLKLFKEFFDRFLAQFGFKTPPIEESPLKKEMIDSAVVPDEKSTSFK